MPHFVYSTAQNAYLSTRDPILGVAISRIGHIHREIFPDPFEALMRSVVAQQISARAAETVFGRLRTLLPICTPEALLALPVEQLRGCGLSGRKAEYLRGIARAGVDGIIDFATLHTLSDEELTRQLVALPGIGVWTAEMQLIFCFQRPDVVSFGDLAIRNGMMRLYGLPTLSKAQFDAYRANYSPHGTVASLYLWALAHEEQDAAEPVVQKGGATIAK